MESSPNTHTSPMDHRRDKDEAMIRKIDARLSEETTLHDGLVWGVEHGWMSQAEAEECEKAYHDALVDVPKLTSEGSSG